MLPLDFTAAADGQLEAWIYRYLQAGEWANRALLAGLRKQPRCWLGPLEIELARLSRCCGPEPGLEFPVPASLWDAKVTHLADTLTEPAAVPPLIVEYRAGALSVRDGSHRHEAMRRKGWLKAWVLIWHNSWSDFEASQKRWGPMGSS